MSLTCSCPVAAAIPNIPISSCPQSIGQIQKVVFQRVFNSDGTKNALDASTANPTLKATWTALLAAANATKVVCSPYLNAPTGEAGAIKTYGSGNEVLGGIPITIGREPSTFTCNLLQQPQVTIEALKSYMCEEVGVYLINENGVIWLLADATTPTEYYPVPIHTFFVGDKTPGGLDSPDMNVMSWYFAPNWSDRLVPVTPTDFNALTDLLTPASTTTTTTT